MVIEALLWKLAQLCHLYMPEGVAEASRIYLRDAHVFPNYLAMRNTGVTGGKPIAV
jgi:hypothetical protein